MDIQVYATLRDLVGSKTLQIDAVSGMTVAQLVERIIARYPLLRDKLLDADGNLQSSIHLLINGREVRYLDGLQTKVAPQDAVRIFPPVGGG
jgi:molybdopterin synthase sulfur carrier subunit